MTRESTTPDRLLVLRTCSPDMTSYGGFEWPEEGPVGAPDWEPTDVCGHGLHGLPWGVGSAATYLSAAQDARWLVVSVEMSPDNYRAGQGELVDKCKFRAGIVVHCGDRESAIAYLDEHGAGGKPVVFASRTAGDRGTATAGYRGTIQIRWWDHDRYRIMTGYVGEDGILPGVPYRLDAQHQLTRNASQ